MPSRTGGASESSDLGSDHGDPRGDHQDFRGLKNQESREERLARTDKVKKEAHKVRRSPGKEMLNRQVDYFEGFKGKGGAPGCDSASAEGAAGGVIPAQEGGEEGPGQQHQEDIMSEGAGQDTSTLRDDP